MLSRAWVLAAVAAFITVETLLPELLCYGRRSLESRAKETGRHRCWEWTPSGAPFLSLHMRALDKVPRVCLAAEKSGIPFHHKKFYSVRDGL